ncbi:hypothetical protein Lfu02_55270 [Longispora fulva]|uniref:Uncharacterized protein n=1 Tax=Longispora fulva TaxID=619741 RepID=A0A8J7KX83_9ACTN|nr:hypothetical protein [Longispora fulva]GIG61155.1 hypothetical protein Lfu02_55270 [Longispora fulva]
MRPRDARNWKARHVEHERAEYMSARARELGRLGYQTPAGVLAEGDSPLWKRIAAEVLPEWREEIVRSDLEGGRERQEVYMEKAGLSRAALDKWIRTGERPERRQSGDCDGPACLCHKVPGWH